MESDLGDAKMGKKKAKRLVTICDLHVHSIRKCLSDSDGASAKYVIDGIVNSGLLQDDSPSFIRNTSYSQEKGQEEQTIITLSPVKKESSGGE